jgi:hypothetical protein
MGFVSLEEVEFFSADVSNTSYQSDGSMHLYHLYINESLI